MALGWEQMILLLMGPVFVLCMALEALWQSRPGRRQTYTPDGTATNIALLVGLLLAQDFCQPGP